MKYPSRKMVIEWNDIRSKNRPRGQRMLFIATIDGVFIGGYDDGKFWDGGDQISDIPKEEILGWAYMKSPIFKNRLDK